MSGTAEPAILRSFDELVERARAVADRGGRRIIGIAGPPGSGKTTIAKAVVAALNAGSGQGEAGEAVHVPMDGFHLADVELVRLGRIQRKGAPDTFDPAGYAALLHRIRGERDGEVVYAPGFDRDIEQPIAGAIPVPPACRLVVTEGNYLLLDEGAWPRARRELDEVWYADVAADERRRRLVARHILFGKAPAAAEAWVSDVDERNALLIAASRATADAVVAGSLRLDQ
jgi:pantothenate kinase